MGKHALIVSLSSQWGFIACRDKFKSFCARSRLKVSQDANNDELAAACKFTVVVKLPVRSAPEIPLEAQNHQFEDIDT